MVPLCKKCHNEVHYGSLVIKGYIDTSNGVKLDYCYIPVSSGTSSDESSDTISNPVSEVMSNTHKTNSSEISSSSNLQCNRKKYNADQIDIINSLKEIAKTAKITKKRACELLEKKHQISISIGTLSKVWNGAY